VRRELRSLTDEDREEWFSAISTYHRTDTEDGRETYGESYFSFQQFTALHNSNTYCYHRCSPCSCICPPDAPAVTLSHACRPIHTTAATSSSPAMQR
jgi:hypothetical protein